LYNKRSFIIIYPEQRSIPIGDDTIIFLEDMVLEKDEPVNRFSGNVKRQRVSPDNRHNSITE